MREAVVVLMLHPTDISLFLGISRKTDHTDFGLPGGKVDPDETKKVAAHRELLEETGIEADRLYEVFTQTCVGEENFNVTTYLCALPAHIQPDTVKSKENSVLKWLTKQELLQGSFGDYNRQLFDHLCIG